jgi:hypothetical protein
LFDNALRVATHPSAAIGVTGAVTALGAAVFWLWLFGDDPWARPATIGLVAVAYIFGLVVLIGFDIAGYRGSRSR